LLVTPTQGSALWINKVGDTWHTLEGFSGGSLKAAGGYISGGTGVVVVDTHRYVNVDLKWPDDVVESEQMVRATSVDEDGNLWVLAGYCDVRLYRADIESGEIRRVRSLRVTHHDDAWWIRKSPPLL